MLIVLNNDILNSVNQNMLNIQERNGLSNIAQAFRLQRHYVYSQYDVLESLSKIDCLSPDDRETYKRILDRYLSLNALKELSIKLNVQKSPVAVRKVENDGYITFNVTLEEMGTGKFAFESQIISESLYDCEFYIWLTEFMKGKTNFLNNKSPLSYKKVHGSGDDIDSVVENEILDKKICLVITDSDKKCKAGKWGDTYGNALSVANKHSDDFIGLVDMIEVREKENLIPPMLMKLTDDAKHCKDLLDDFEIFYKNKDSEEAYYYLDLKDGVDGEHYLTKKETKEFVDLIVNNNSLKIINKEGINRISNDNKEKLFHGISRQVQPVIKDILKGGLSKKLDTKLKCKSDIPEGIIQSYQERCSSVVNVFESFSDIHKEEWFRIANLVQNFCCSPSEAFF